MRSSRSDSSWGKSSNHKLSNVNRFICDNLGPGPGGDRTQSSQQLGSAHGFTSSSPSDDASLPHWSSCCWTTMCDNMRVITCNHMSLHTDSTHIPAVDQKRTQIHLRSLHELFSIGLTSYFAARLCAAVPGLPVRNGPAWFVGRSVFHESLYTTARFRLWENAIN